MNHEKNIDSISSGTGNEGCKTKLLKLVDIASWWLPSSISAYDVKAELPALQRGFVWKPAQVEYLWDSIAQGFPIGSLLLTEFDELKGTATKHGSDKKKDTPQFKPTHHLLDGQQRATSIALGFRNIWKDIDGDLPTEALWVDLQPLEKSDRRFSFRLVTKSHPWGYSQNDPSNRLKDWKAREALSSFQELNDAVKKKPHKFDISQVFPWDAKAPVPLALLLSSIQDDKENCAEDVAVALLQRLESIGLWKKPSKHPEQFKYVHNILSEQKDRDFKGFKELINGLRNALEFLNVPAPIFREKDKGSDKQNEQLSSGQRSEQLLKDEHDKTFNLFQRVNTGGTRLSSEDIKYSLLKSIWIEAPQIIEDKLLKGREFAQPARMVTLMSRLFLMAQGSKKVVGLQPDLSINQFKEMVTDKVKGECAFSVFCNKNGSEVVDDVWLLLADNGDSNGYGLPKFLAAQISRSSTDLMLLVMYWVYRLRENKIFASQFNEDEKKKILGFVTALAWFSMDQRRCIQKLATMLKEMEKEGGDTIRHFFNSGSFFEILSLDDQGRILMVPLPTPEVLEKTLLYDDLKNELNLNRPPNIESDLWKTRVNLEQHYLGDKPPGKMNEIIPPDWCADETQKRKDAAWSLISRICRDPNRHLLVYAQREIMKDEEWFGWFDPTQPDQIRDRNRPWDYDHILPQSWSHYEGGRIFSLPKLVKIWVWSVGNFRIWPLECNRSKGADEMIETKLEAYKLKDQKDVCCKSFICNEDKWGELEVNLPKENDEIAFWKGGNDKESRKHWQLFIQASIERTVDIYAEWYRKLNIEALMKEE